MNKPISKVDANRQLLTDAHAAGTGATLAAFVRLSGPGWLQSAITLGSGSLAGALFLGALGGTKLLWLQLIAISMGVVMLSAISYVTLSTGERPFRAINEHINPVLGWGWLIATCMANMIWCMPQFSL
jgi:Mn2+/Fe2+ NRAMP family transporter